MGGLAYPRRVLGGEEGTLTLSDCFPSSPLPQDLSNIVEAYCNMSESPTTSNILLPSMHIYVFDFPRNELHLDSYVESTDIWQSFIA